MCVGEGEGVDVDAGAGPRWWVGFAVWLTCWVWMVMLVQLWRPEFGLDGVDFGSWCHCLPVGMHH